MKSGLPIGVFDSGLGGLTVLKEIRKLFPNQDIVYFGDTARVPYGTRSGDVVRKFALEDTEFLISKNVKCIIIACNTASAYATEFLKDKFDLPIFDVISPAARKAATVTKNKKVGVIATRGTVSSGMYRKMINKFDKSIEVFERACPLFVPFVEENEIKGELIKGLCHKYLKEIKDAKVDTLIMGCTHYPVIKGLIQNEVGENVILINPGCEVADELHPILYKSKDIGKIFYYVSDMTDRFVEVAESFMGKKINHIEKVNLKS